MKWGDPGRQPPRESTLRGDIVFAPLSLASERRWLWGPEVFGTSTLAKAQSGAIDSVAIRRLGESLNTPSLLSGPPALSGQSSGGNRAIALSLGRIPPSAAPRERGSRRERSLGWLR